MLAGQDLSTLDAIFVALAGMAIVLLELALLAVCILIISRVVRFTEKRFSKETPQPVTQTATPVQSGTPLPDTVSIGNLTLIDTDEPTAAVIMAIVSDSSGIPLNRLNFKSIKRMGD